MPSTFSVSPEFAAKLERAATIDNRVPYWTWRLEFQAFVLEHRDECLQCLCDCIKDAQDRQKLEWLATQLLFTLLPQSWEDMSSKINNEWTEA